VTRTGDHPDDVDQRLNDAAGRVRATVQPLLQTLNLDQQSVLWSAARAAGADEPSDDPAAADTPRAD
jgi:hypothetical protein